MLKNFLEDIFNSYEQFLETYKTSTKFVEMEGIKVRTWDKTKIHLSRYMHEHIRNDII